MPDSHKILEAAQQQVLVDGRGLTEAQALACLKSHFAKVVTTHTREERWETLTMVRVL
jgi:biotin synthase-like enzyme